MRWFWVLIVIALFGVPAFAHAVAAAGWVEMEPLPHWVTAALYACVGAFIIEQHA